MGKARQGTFIYIAPFNKVLYKKRNQSFQVIGEHTLWNLLSPMTPIDIGKVSALHIMELNTHTLCIVSDKGEVLPKIQFENRFVVSFPRTDDFL